MTVLVVMLTADDNFDWTVENGEFMVRKIIQRYLDARAKNMTVEDLTKTVFNVSFLKMIIDKE